MEDKILSVHIAFHLLELTEIRRGVREATPESVMRSMFELGQKDQCELGGEQAVGSASDDGIASLASPPATPDEPDGWPIWRVEARAMLFWLATWTGQGRGLMEDDAINQMDKSCENIFVLGGSLDTAPDAWACRTCGKVDWADTGEQLAKPEHVAHRGVDIGTCSGVMVRLSIIQTAGE